MSKGSRKRRNPRRRKTTDQVHRFQSRPFNFDSVRRNDEWSPVDSGEYFSPELLFQDHDQVINKNLSQDNDLWRRNELGKALRSQQEVRSDSPDKTKTVCDQRRERREVLFARGVGGTRTAPPVFTIMSKVRCK